MIQYSIFVHLSSPIQFQSTQTTQMQAAFGCIRVWESAWSLPSGERLRGSTVLA